MPWPFVTLRGEHVELVPLDFEKHADALFDCTPPETFQWFLSWPDPWTRENFRAWLGANLGKQEWRPQVVIDRTTQRVVGSTSFLDVDEKNRSVEVGFTWYAPEARGTMVNPECKLLMLTHALETMGCVRVTLKTDARNLRSQRAMAALGFVREGTLRAHRIRQSGEPRDSVYFGVLPSDWERVRAILLARLHPPTSPEPPAAPFTVRPAAEADVPGVIPLVRIICNQHEGMDPERFTFRPDIIERYEEWLPQRARDRRSVFLVAETPDRRIVGHIVCTIEPEIPIYWTPESAWIHDVCVDPAWRGRGVGAALVKSAVHAIEKLGVARIRLETAAANETVRTLFKACGFRHSTTEMMMTLRPPARRVNP